MSIAETRHGKESFSQRLARAKEVEGQQLELKRKMEAIQLFPGNLEEFSQLTGENYDFVKLSEKRKFLEGGRSNWRFVDSDNRPPFKNRDFFNPLTWRKTNVGVFGSYSEILARAVELGADALIHYSKIREGEYGVTREIGVPVKRVNPSSNPQSH